MKRFALLLLNFTSLAYGQDVPLELSGDVAKVKVDKIVVIQEDRTLVKSFTPRPLLVKAPEGGILYQWQYPAGVVAVRKANVLEIKSAPKGPLTVAVEWAIVDFDKKLVTTKFGQVAFDVGDVTPPIPPVPPVPPEPVPTVGPIKVLISYESSRANNDANLNKIISGGAIREYMASKGAKDGQTSSFRAYDKDLAMDKELPWVQAADKRRKDKAGSVSEWIVISDAKDAIQFDGPLPKDETETLNLLKKYGG